jgi:hypothetical protein
MSFSKESAVSAAKRDLASRLRVNESEIKELSVEDADFPDASLGAPGRDEVSAQMISSGWKINLGVGGNSHEYRADKYQLRLHNFNGRNYVIKK